MEYVPPNLEEHYTILTVKEHFIVFWCILAAQSLTLMIAKYFTSDQFKNLMWYDKGWLISEGIFISVTVKSPAVDCLVSKDL